MKLFKKKKKVFQLFPSLRSWFYVGQNDAGMEAGKIVAPALLGQGGGAFILFIWIYLLVEI